MRVPGPPLCKVGVFDQAATANKPPACTSNWGLMSATKVRSRFGKRQGDGQCFFKGNEGDVGHDPIKRRDQCHPGYRLAFNPSRLCTCWVGCDMRGCNLAVAHIQRMNTRGPSCAQDFGKPPRRCTDIQRFAVRCQVPEIERMNQFQRGAGYPRAGVFGKAKRGRLRDGLRCLSRGRAIDQHNTRL